MNLGFISAIGSALLAASVVACGGSGPTEGEAGTTAERLVDAPKDEEADLLDDDLGPDRAPMLSDEEVDALAARPDRVQDSEAEEDFAREERLAAGEPEPEDDDVEVVKRVEDKTTKAAPHCKKRINVTYAVYTFITAKIGSNGCWLPENTVADDNVRECHSDGSIEHSAGRRWFYDDTNPENPLATERARVDECSGKRAGYEYMAFRNDEWRLIKRPHAYAYFAELYTDDAHIDSLYYDSSAYRSNGELKGRARVAPMVNFGPYPADRYSLHTVGVEVLKICKTIHNHGYLGLYEWHYPIDYGSPRAKNLANALNACTRI
jgi:hypothetical protein